MQLATWSTASVSLACLLAGVVKYHDPNDTFLAASAGRIKNNEFLKNKNNQIFYMQMYLFLKIDPFQILEMANLIRPDLTVAYHTSNIKRGLFCCQS